MRPWMEIDWSPHVRERAVDGRTVRYLDYGEGPAPVLVPRLGGPGRRETREGLARAARLRRLMVWPMVKDPSRMSLPFALETIPLAAAPGFLGALTSAAKAVADVRPQDVSCPVLLLWGREDRI